MRNVPGIEISIDEVLTRRQLKAFIRLPYRIHKGHSRWVPPLLQDEWHFFDGKKNPTFRYNDTVLFLARIDKTPVGRIMGIINRRRNERLFEKNAYFGYLECFDDPLVAQALLQKVEEWAALSGMEKMLGPLGFNDQDQKGFIVEGFEYEPSTQAAYNFEYMPALVENSGYTKEIDYVVYQIDTAPPVPEVYKRIVDRLCERGSFALHDFTKKRELKPWIKPVLQLMNETFSELFGYDALSNEEMRRLGKKFLPVIDPRFARIALANGTLVAFILGIPNLNNGLRKAKGRLLPFGLFHLIRASKKTTQLDLLIAGVRSEYRGIGLDVYGMMKTIMAAREAGFTVVDSHHELETNLAVRHVMERWGGKVHKRFRVYQKTLSQSDKRSLTKNPAYDG